MGVLEGLLLVKEQMVQNGQAAHLILFLKNDSIMTKRYQFGLVNEIYPGKDGFVRKAKIMYQNYEENVKRETYRAVREIVVIHHVDEIDLVDNLNEMSRHMEEI